MAFYLNQKIKYQGFASLALKANCGSKLNLFFRTATSKIAAGSLRLNAGTSDMPLLVRDTVPETTVFVLSASCEKPTRLKWNRKNKRMFFSFLCFFKLARQAGQIFVHCKGRREMSQGLYCEAQMSLLKRPFVNFDIISNTIANILNVVDIQFDIKFLTLLDLVLYDQILKLH